MFRSFKPEQSSEETEDEKANCHAVDLMWSWWLWWRWYPWRQRPWCPGRMGGRSCWRSWLQDLEELPTPRLEECQAKILHHPVHPKLGPFILHWMIMNDMLDCGGAEKKGCWFRSWWWKARKIVFLQDLIHQVSVFFISAKLWGATNPGWFDVAQRHSRNTRLSLRVR